MNAFELAFIAAVLADQHGLAPISPEDLKPTADKYGVDLGAFAAAHIASGWSPMATPQYWLATMPHNTPAAPAIAQIMADNWIVDFIGIGAGA